MKLRKALTALALCLCMMTGLLPAGAAYQDISGGELTLAAATLTSLGVVNGYPDGGFHPGDGLDRGQFCKLAVLAGGYADQLTAAAYQTVFDDVPANHWAAKYINLACSLGLVSGYGNGSFGPDDPVTLGQAAKVLLGLLGYTTEDIGPFFPEDYLTRAASLDLTEGMELEDTPLTRGDTALLLYRLLSLPIKEGKDFYTRLGQTVVEDVVLLDAGEVSVIDGRTIETYTANTALDSALEGQRGALLLDKQGLLCGFVPDEECLSLTLSSAEADGITAGGKSYDLDETVAVVSDDELVTYADVWFSLRAGDKVTLYQNAGKIYLMVLDLQGQSAGNQVVGRLESASPNLRRATSITLQGAALAVSEQGQSSLADCSIGDLIEVTLDRSGRVASAQAATSQNGVGVLSLTGERASVALPGATISGELASTKTDLTSLNGSLVRVRVDSDGELSISTLPTQSHTEDLDVARGTFGDTPLAAGALLYERVGAAPVRAITLDDILTATVEGKNIDYVGYNAAGEVNLLLLQDVTGNCYTYGTLVRGTKTTGGGQMSATNTTVTVENGDNDPTAWISGASFQNKSFGGVATNAATGKAAGVATLTALENLTRSDFGADGTLGGLPIAEKVQVYDATTELWTTLSQVQGYAASFTAYYDRTPQAGGQVRVIVVGQ